MRSRRRVPVYYRVRGVEVYNAVDFPLRSGARVSAPWTAPTFQFYTWMTYAKGIAWLVLVVAAGIGFFWGAAVEFWGIFHGLI